MSSACDYWTMLSNVDYSNEDTFYFKTDNALILTETVRGNILIVDGALSRPRTISVTTSRRKLYTIIREFRDKTKSSQVPILVTKEDPVQSHLFLVVLDFNLKAIIIVNTIYQDIDYFDKGDINKALVDYLVATLPDLIDSSTWGVAAPKIPFKRTDDDTLTNECVVYTHLLFKMILRGISPLDFIPTLTKDKLNTLLYNEAVEMRKTGFVSNSGIYETALFKKMDGL